MYSEYWKMLGSDDEIPEFESEEEVNAFLRELDEKIVDRMRQTRWMYPESTFRSFVTRENVSLHRIRHMVAQKYYDRLHQRRGKDKEEEAAG